MQLPIVRRPRRRLIGLVAAALLTAVSATGCQCMAAAFANEVFGTNDIVDCHVTEEERFLRTYYPRGKRPIHYSSRRNP